MEFIKEFSTENFNSHERAVVNHKYTSWPYILVLSDSCLMFKSTPAQIEPPNMLVTNNNKYPFKWYNLDLSRNLTI